MARLIETLSQELDWDVEADVVIAGASVAGYSPVAGSYGVGNCIASPSGQAYLAGGATFGPIITFACFAARSVVAQPVKEIGMAAVA
jgi:hypothetical protein